VFVAFAVLAVSLVSGCEPLPTTPLSSASPCYVGTWTVSGEQIADAVSSFGVPITIAPTDDGTGVTATISDDGHWSISANQGFTVVASGVVDGRALVDAEASGTYTADATTMTFVLDDVSGTVNFTGTFLGRAVDDATLTLDQVGARALYGWTGSAGYTCGDAGPTLVFDGFTFQL
jgi:hypothetical protein